MGSFVRHSKLTKVTDWTLDIQRFIAIALYVAVGAHIIAAKSREVVLDWVPPTSLGKSAE